MNQSCVFNAYLYDLMNKGHASDYYSPEYFDVWFYNKGASEFKSRNNIDDRLGSYSNLVENIKYLGNLHATEITTTDSDGLPSEDSYSKLLNIPVSAFIFSEKDNPSSSDIRHDINYNGFDYTVNQILSTGKPAETFINMSDDKSKWKYMKSYFQQEYAFSDEFVENEYLRYEIPLDYVVGEETHVKPIHDTVIYNTHGNMGGGLLITRYDGARNKDVMTQEQINKQNDWPAISGMPVNPENAIPCVYFDLPKTYNPINSELKIQWSENGLFTLK